MTDNGTQQADALRQWRIKIFASTWVAYAGYYFCRKSFFIIKGTLGDEAGFDALTLGHIGTVFLAAYALGQFVSAAIGPRTGPRLLLLVGMAASIGANIAFGFANNAWTFMAFMAFNGLAQATGWPSTIGTLGHWTRRKERGTLLGFWATCYQLGGVMANAWAALWLARQGWRGAFFAGSAVLAVAWVVVWLFQRNRPEDVGLPPLEELDEDHRLGEPATSKEGAPSVWTRSVITTVVLIGAVYFGVKFVRYALWSWTPYFLQKNFGLAGDDAGYLSTVFDIAGFLGVIVAGVVSDRLFGGRRGKVAFIMIIGMTFGAGLLYLVGPLSVFWFATSIALIGFMLYGPDALLSGAGAIDVGSRRAALTAAGIINGMGSVGSVLQEAVVAKIYAGGEGKLSGVFALLFGASLFSVAALAIVLVRNRRGLSDL